MGAPIENRNISNPNIYERLGNATNSCIKDMPTIIGKSVAGAAEVIAVAPETGVGGIVAGFLKTSGTEICSRVLEELTKGTSFSPEATTVFKNFTDALSVKGWTDAAISDVGKVINKVPGFNLMIKSGEDMIQGISEETYKLIQNTIKKNIGNGVEASPYNELIKPSKKNPELEITPEANPTTKPRGKGRNPDFD